MSQYCGTGKYMAPGTTSCKSGHGDSRLQSFYTTAIDMWELLRGYKQSREIELLRAGEFPDGCPLSDEVEDFICGMLAVEPSERLMLDGVLDHPWIVEYGSSKIKKTIHRRRCGVKRSAPGFSSNLRKFEQRVTLASAYQYHIKFKASATYHLIDSRFTTSGLHTFGCNHRKYLKSKGSRVVALTQILLSALGAYAALNRNGLFIDFLCRENVFTCRIINGRSLMCFSNLFFTCNEYCALSLFGPAIKVLLQ
ncbi:hypothetical protein SELMODRAFT_424021 [Selaginella moellendorffii]|uniref:Protein kinase domain-containing protein n=2 Tax=Selaginella moellendorffii TaxID=88036 RepID=D8SNJ4_SELML|nr:hypothetical protein SELMODRAFT_424021 [Selaginella moellendorffii]